MVSIGIETCSTLFIEYQSSAGKIENVTSRMLFFFFFFFFIFSSFPSPDYLR